MKRITALILCIIMAFCILPASAFSAERDFATETALAERLRGLGLFKGVSETDFALDRAPTRTEALIMLVRVLGKENEALAKGGKHPFTDVPAWADKYVGYAYENKLTNGMSATKFGSNTAASIEMYLTFMLRAMGYSDTNGLDFTYSNPFECAKSAGLLAGAPDRESFLRADVVLVSYAALGNPSKGVTQTLGNKLVELGAYTKEVFEKYYQYNALFGSGLSVSDELVIK